MNSWLIVIPSINKEWSQQCINSLIDNKTKFDYLIVDNTEKNYGVSGAWNMGVDKVLDNGIDWLVICSESVRFGKNGAKDIQKNLNQAAANEMTIEGEDGFGWHLIAMRKELLEVVGYFDEIFFPAYFEDNDYIYRTHKIREKMNKDWLLWKKVKIDASLIGIAQGLKLLDYQIDFGWLKEKYKEKWGGSPEEVYDYPYNNPNLSLRYAERYNR